MTLPSIGAISIFMVLPGCSTSVTGISIQSNACCGMVISIHDGLSEKLAATSRVWSSKSLRKAKCLFLSNPSELMLQ